MWGRRRTAGHYTLFISVPRKRARHWKFPVQGFANNLDLADKRLLEVGAGSGTLRDIVPN